MKNNKPHVHYRTGTNGANDAYRPICGCTHWGTQTDMPAYVTCEKCLAQMTEIPNAGIAYDEEKKKAWQKANNIND